MQFDEKWPFVGKKEKHCDPADPDDAKRGDSWDHVALDAERRLVVSVVPGKRAVEDVESKCLSKINSAVLWCSRPGCLGRRDACTTTYSWTG
ncbi:MAG: hypothetical protein NTW96_07915, partial [Planctomycetia bacterium]|nr:hypothetical protein [Planctomycetia bacterium]